mmetsp:Transcript_104060/g.269400  ORF Transcript_104060/g.269400 Transcript_104060/m.269400 type:complete len:212 (-) Transcript_104060:97-732(-)
MPIPRLELLPLQWRSNLWKSFRQSRARLPNYGKSSHLSRARLPCRSHLIPSRRVAHQHRWKRGWMQRSAARSYLARNRCGPRRSPDKPTSWGRQRCLPGARGHPRRGVQARFPASAVRPASRGSTSGRGGGVRSIGKSRSGERRRTPGLRASSRGLLPHERSSASPRAMSKGDCCKVLGSSPGRQNVAMWRPLTSLRAMSMRHRSHLARLE